MVDPDGKLAGLVKADKDVATNSLHLTHTPTIYLVSNKPSKPYVEVTDTTQLYVMIDAMKKE